MANGEEQRALPAEIGEAKKKRGSRTNQQIIIPGVSQKKYYDPQDSQTFQHIFDDDPLLHSYSVKLNRLLLLRIFLFDRREL